MLLAVEGGGFFSSSASGYSKGLTLLLLGQKSEEKPMRVTPWTQYQLVDQESDNSNLQLASGKNRLVGGCTSFVCFGHTSAGRESPSTLKVGPAQQQDILAELPVPDKRKEEIPTTDIVEVDIIGTKVELKSSLKKATSTNMASSGVCNDSEALCENGSSIHGQMERMKVQWTDVSGGELVEIREFEASDDGRSDDEYGNGNKRTCLCKIM